MELVTGHAGSNHITALQVSRLLKGVTATDESTVHRLNVGNLCALTYSGITMSIASGEMLLNGFHVTLTDDTGGTSGEELVLDATVEETNSRIDKIVLEIIQDNTTSYQTAEIVIVQGEEAESPVAPDTPTEPDSSTQEFLAVGVIAQVTVTADAITSLTDYTNLYGGNYASLTDFESIIAGIASEYDETVTYAAGQYVIYEHTLYKCILSSTGNDPTNTTYFNTAVLSNDVQTNTTNISTNTTNISETQDIISDAWDQSTTYAAGDYAIHNNKLYKCLVACTGVEPPNVTYWEQTTCAAEYSSINNNLTNLSDSKSNLLVVTTASTTVNVSAGYSAWSISQTKSGYTPLMWTLYNGNSPFTIWNVEGLSLTSGSFTIGGFAKNVNADATTTLNARILWVKDS